MDLDPTPLTIPSCRRRVTDPDWIGILLKKVSSALLFEGNGSAQCQPCKKGRNDKRLRHCRETITINDKDCNFSKPIERLLAPTLTIKDNGWSQTLINNPVTPTPTINNNDDCKSTGGQKLSTIRRLEFLFER